MEWLFHKDVFIPERDKVNQVVSKMEKHITGYEFTNHFKRHMEQEKKDRSHEYVDDVVNKCLERLKEGTWEPFEVAIEFDIAKYGDMKCHVSKYCVRIPYNDEDDFAVSIRPTYVSSSRSYDWNKNVVITGWLNAHSDNHITLRPENYTTQSEWENVFSKKN